MDKINNLLHQIYLLSNWLFNSSKLSINMNLLQDLPLFLTILVILLINFHYLLAMNYPGTINVMILIISLTLLA